MCLEGSNIDRRGTSYKKSKSRRAQACFNNDLDKCIYHVCTHTEKKSANNSIEKKVLFYTERLTKQQNQ